jgi:TatA/E family protein of Tat protein translocase
VLGAAALSFASRRFPCAGYHEALRGLRSIDPLGLPMVQPVLGFFGIGTTEFLIVLVVVLLLFSYKLPSLARSLGRSIVEFKKGVKELEDGSPDDPAGPKT